MASERLKLLSAMERTAVYPPPEAGELAKLNSSFVVVEQNNQESDKILFEAGNL